MRRALSVVLAAAMMVGVFALPAVATSGSITDKVVEDERFDVLEKLVVDAGLANTLAETPDLTVFAPTDFAFRRLVFELTRDWRTAFRSSDTEIAEAVQGVAGDGIGNILGYHVYTGGVVPFDVAKTLRTDITMFNGGDVNVRGIADRFVRLTDESNRKMWVVIPDIEASNGVIHGISRVLLPGS